MACVPYRKVMYRTVSSLMNQNWQYLNWRWTHFIIWTWQTPNELLPLPNLCLGTLRTVLR